jgi:sulfate adenylyltransferase large subunit
MIGEVVELPVERAGNEDSALKIVVVGHVDHGKSTVIGRLLHDTNSLPEGVVEKARRIARDTGQPFEYAYLLDAFEEEQKQGITIDTTQIQFRTEKRDYVIIDAPGHKEFLKNMISGAAGAEAAFLIIDAREGVQEQSKRHAYILSLLGIRSVYIVLNKMDLVGYSKEVYERIRADMEEFLSSLRVHPIDYIPVSAYEGENILGSSEKLGWFGGPSLIDAMDGIEHEKGLENLPLRLPVQDVYKFDERRIIAGRIERGSLREGDVVVLYPSGKSTRVRTLEFWPVKDHKDVVRAGESVGITVADEFFNKRGEIVSLESGGPLVSNRFRANVFWMGASPMLKGRKYKIKIATDEVAGEVEEILRVIDSSTLDASGHGDEVALNDVAEVIVRTERSVVFDAFADCASTGRFVLVDGYNVAGGGIIIQGEREEATEKLPTFTGESVRAGGDLFREFYFNLSELSGVGESRKAGESYSVGDAVPLKGESYSYPEDFDVICLSDEAAVSIRSGLVSEIRELSAFALGHFPIVDERGFAIRAQAPEEFALFLEDYRRTDAKTEKEFFDKWLRFDVYRSMIFHGGYGMI